MRKSMFICKQFLVILPLWVLTSTGIRDEELASGFAEKKAELSPASYDSEHQPDPTESDDGVARNASEDADLIETRNVTEKQQSEGALEGKDEPARNAMQPASNVTQQQIQQDDFIPASDVEWKVQIAEYEGLMDPGEHSKLASGLQPGSTTLVIRPAFKDTCPKEGTPVKIIGPKTVEGHISGCRNYVDSDFDAAQIFIMPAEKKAAWKVQIGDYEGDIDVQDESMFDGFSEGLKPEGLNLTVRPAFQDCPGEGTLAKIIGPAGSGEGVGVEGADDGSGAGSKEFEGQVSSCINYPGGGEESADFGEAQVLIKRPSEDKPAPIEDKPAPSEEKPVEKPAPKPEESSSSNMPLYIIVALVVICLIGGVVWWLNSDNGENSGGNPAGQYRSG